MLGSIWGEGGGGGGFRVWGFRGIGFGVWAVGIWGFRVWPSVFSKALLYGPL